MKKQITIDTDEIKAAGKRVATAAVETTIATAIRTAQAISTVPGHLNKGRNHVLDTAISGLKALKSGNKRGKSLRKKIAEIIAG